MDQDATVDELKRRLAEADALISSLRESEARHRLLTESWAQASWETDAAGVVVTDSPTWRAYTGQMLHEWLGYGWLDAIHPDDRAYAERQWREAVAARRVVDAEFRLRAPDGGWRWTNVRAAPVLAADGNIEKWAGLNIDIDARKRAEVALRESEEKYRTLFESIDEGFCVLEILYDEGGEPQDCRYVEVNPAFLKQTGQDDPTGKLGSEYVPASAPMWLATYDAVVRSGDPVRFEQFHPDSGRWYSVYASPIGERGSRLVASVFADVTERKRAEAALRESEEKYRNLFERMGQGYSLNEVVRDAEGNAIDLRYLELNPAFERLTGASLSEARGRLASEVFPGLDRFWVDICDRAVKTGVIERIEHELTPNGRWYQSNFYPIGGDLCLSLYDDITDRKRAEEALRDSEERLARDLEATQVLQKVSNQLISKPGVNGHFIEICEAARALMRSDCASIQAYDEAGCRLKLVGHVGFHPDSAAFWEWVDAGIGSSCGRALSTGERVIVQDMDLFEANPLDVEAYRRSDILSVQSTPLVARTGEVVGMMSTHWHRRDVPAEAIYRHFDILARLAADFIVRIRAEAALRENEAHLATELKHTELLRELALRVVAEKSFSTIYSDILSTAVAITGADAGTVQAYEPDTKSLVLLVTQGIPSRMTEHFHHVDASSTTACGVALRTGQRSFIDFDEDDTDEACLMHVEAGLRSAQATPLVSRNGSPIGMINTHWRLSGHRPSQDQLRFLDLLARQAADLIERRRDAEALRESEERFRQFAEASSGALWIRDAGTLRMEYVSPSVNKIYGVEPDAFLGDIKRWAALIVPEDRDVALQHIEAASKGESVVHEFRIQRPSDGAFRWIRNKDFPLHNDNGSVQRIGGIAEDITEEKQNAEHQAVLLAELQHRVRNIMAVVRSVATRSGERAASVHEYAELLAGRLLALSRVQTLLTRAANVSVRLRSIVLDEISVQAQHEGQYEVDGPDVDISPKAAEVLTLALHELSTNALKYGALSDPEGKVSVRWEIVDKNHTPWLSLDWIEKGAGVRTPTPDKPRRRGFGSELIEGRIPYELKGRGRLVIGQGGAECHLEFPLKAGASILETGAPQRATVFGGALDMTGEPDLCGLRIMVVEDDYYLATDAARALRGARADVVGPCSSEEEAREELSKQRPDAVLLDINLGSGPTFKLAEHLKDNGIPFLFVTGYDQAVIPAEFEAIDRLEKPIQLRRLVAGVWKLLSDAKKDPALKATPGDLASQTVARANIDRFLDALESENDGSILHKLILEEERKLARQTEHLEFAETRTARLRKRHDGLSSWRDGFIAGTIDRQQADRVVASSHATLQSMEAFCQHLRDGTEPPL